MSIKERKLFENAHFVAVDKPAGWLSVPGRLGESDARLCVGIELQKDTGRLWPVHRLDAEVSGLLLFARSAAAHREASMWFESRSLHKSYVALSEGERDPTWMPGREFKWECRILRGKKRAFESPHGKDSLTRAVWRGETVGGTQKWDLEPLTGRSHQLRFELARHGFPVVGDKLYGAQRAFTEDGIALRSVKLDFSEVAGAAKFDLPTTLVAPVF